jgi:hypothetical protein
MLSFLLFKYVFDLSPSKKQNESPIGKPEQKEQPPEPEVKAASAKSASQ